MGIFGGTDAPDLRPFLDMVKKSVNNAEGKMANYDTVVDNFTKMGYDRYNASQELFGPWQERMNDIFMQTDANSYGTQQRETFGASLANFNKRANDKFFKAGIPMGSAVGSQRGLSQQIQSAQYSAGVDFTAKHQVAQIHEKAMQTGDYAMQTAFNQLTAGVNMQQAVSSMYASNASNEQSQTMMQAKVQGSGQMFNAMQNQQKENAFMSNVGSALGYGMTADWNFDSAPMNAGQGPTVQNANGMQSGFQTTQQQFGNYNGALSPSSNMGGIGSAGYGFNF